MFTSRNVIHHHPFVFCYCNSGHMSTPTTEPDLLKPTRLVVAGCKAIKTILYGLIFSPFSFWPRDSRNLFNAAQLWQITYEGRAVDLICLNFLKAFGLVSKHKRFGIACFVIDCVESFLILQNFEAIVNIFLSKIDISGAPLMLAYRPHFFWHLHKLTSL